MRSEGRALSQPKSSDEDTDKRAGVCTTGVSYKTYSNDIQICENPVHSMKVLDRMVRIISKHAKPRGSFTEREKYIT